MADLIDRAALFADIDETVVYSGRIGTNAEMRGANKIINRIKAAPAVDAVEVVRCGECVMRSKESDNAVCCKLLHDLVMPKTGFCNYGRRSHETD